MTLLLKFMFKNWFFFWIDQNSIWNSKSALIQSKAFVKIKVWVDLEGSIIPKLLTRKRYRVITVLFIRVNTVKTQTQSTKNTQHNVFYSENISPQLSNESIKMKPFKSFKNISFNKKLKRSFLTLILYWRISGKFLRPFYWKTRPKESILSKIIFHEFWGVTEWKFRKILDESSSKTAVGLPGKWIFSGWLFQ